MNKWNKIPFTESIVKNKTAVSSVNASDYLETGAIPVIDQSVDFIAGYTNKAERIVSKELLPVIVFGDHTRVLKYIDFPFVTGADGTKLLFPNKSLFNSKFFYYNLLSKPLPNRGYNRHFKLLQELTIDLPTQTQQHVIVHILDTLDKKINLIKNELTKYKQLKQSLMEKLFSVGLYKEKSKITELGSVPGSWRVENFECLRIDLIDGDRSSNYPSGDDVLSTGNIIFLSTKNIEKERFVFQEKRFISEEKYKKLRKGQLQEGDIVITVRGTLGNVALFKDLEYTKGFINAQMLIIRNLSEYIDTEYLALYLTTPIFQQQIIANRSGSAQYQIPKGTFSKLLLLIPPKEEQQEISNILSICNQKIRNLETQIEETTKLFNSLLNRLMNNEIDVSNLEFENA